MDIPGCTVLQSTFACSMNSIGTRCLVVEMGVGMRLTLLTVSSLPKEF